MVKFPGSDVVYEVADRFREQCPIMENTPT
jgi:hypothetical protein